MTRKRISKIHHRSQHPEVPHSIHKTTHRRPIRATFPDPARSHHSPKMDEKPPSVFLVAKRPPLANYPFLWRWLARYVYKKIHWSPDFGIEYQGVYESEAAARFAASMPGGFYMELPLNVELPQETAQYGKHDFPLSEASAEYRTREFAMVAVPRSSMIKLEHQIQRTQPLVNEYHKSA